MDIRAELLRIADLINAAFESQFADADSDFSELWDAELYALAAGGKRIRPFLTLKTCTMLGGKEEDALPLALALEMVHT